MNKRILMPEQLVDFSAALAWEEKSKATCQKYLRDVTKFAVFADGAEVTKETVVAWKNRLLEEGYGVRSVNSMLAAVNSLMNFLGWHECRVKNLRLQHRAYCTEDAELTKEEYFRLLGAAEGEKQLRLVLQAICGTGIRVSELQFFTVEALRCGEITVNCKSKTRTILIPGALCRMLLHYAAGEGIGTGPVFRGRGGKVLDRSVIWRQMKGLCAAAGIKETKVYPHNLRKLFACTFYASEKDIAKLADILGHSSVNTTRLYIMTTGREHREKIERLGLVLSDEK